MPLDLTDPFTRIVIGFLLIYLVLGIGAAFALFRAPEGYEDSTGFHEGRRK